MCAASILRAGFNCVALGDDDAAGVGIRYDMPTLPPSLQARARGVFGSAAVLGRRAFIGAGGARFRKAAKATDFETAMNAFDASHERVRRITAGAGAGSPDVAPSGGPSLVLDVDPDAVWMADGPARGVRDFLSVAERLRHDGSTAALVDGAGRLLYAAGGCTSRSPIRTAVMECVRGFVRDRAHLERAIGSALPPSDLTLLIAGKIEREEEAILALGAAGSFVEAPLEPGRAPFVQLVGSASPYAEWLVELLDRFPPFYRDFVGLRVGVAPPSV
jgi:hypothetical protein